MKYDRERILGKLLILTWILAAKYWINIELGVSVKSELMPKLSSAPSVLSGQYAFHYQAQFKLSKLNYCYDSGIPPATRDNLLSADLDCELEAWMCVHF